MFPRLDSGSSAVMVTFILSCWLGSHHLKAGQQFGGAEGVMHPGVPGGGGPESLCLLLLLGMTALVQSWAASLARGGLGQAQGWPREEAGSPAAGMPARRSLDLAHRHCFPWASGASPIAHLCSPALYLCFSLTSLRDRLWLLPRWVLKCLFCASPRNHGGPPSSPKSWAHRPSLPAGPHLLHCPAPPTPVPSWPQSRHCGRLVFPASGERPLILICGAGAYPTLANPLSLGLLQSPGELHLPTSHKAIQAPLRGQRGPDCRPKNRGGQSSAGRMQRGGGSPAGAAS